MAKFRNGFVTNSSSSSFIIALDKLPTSVKEVKKLLFRAGESFYPSWCSNESFNTDEIADRVFRELKNSKATDEDKIRNSFEGWADDRPDFYHKYTKGLEFGSEAHRAAGQRAWEEEKKWVDNKFNEFMKKNKGKHVVALEFSDNDGLMDSSIERGDLFDHLNPVKISHH
jgi:hypothetical protein